MNTFHRLESEQFTERDGLAVMRAWCWCGQPFITAASTLRRARRRCYLARLDHYGFAYAAGPGTGRAA